MKKKRVEATTDLGLSVLVALISVALAIKFSWESAWLNTELRFEAARLNNTVHAEREILFFNRVPKVGSQTIMSLLQRLQRVNNFTHIVDREDIKASQGEKTILTVHEQETYAKMFLRNFTPPASYSKHISYIDFNTMEGRYFQPIYINFVREPVERLISWYYYIRAPWYLFTFKNGNQTEFKDFKPFYGGSTKRYKTTYDECVARGLPECRYVEGNDHVTTREGGSHASQIMFFCGHHDYCRVINGERAFKEAVRNVEREYAVVGILEELQKSFFVLERFVPRFFSGVSEEYAKRNTWMRHINKNIYRPSVKPETRDRIRANVTREVEFYEFCRQRLHRQYLAVGGQT